MGPAIIPVLQMRKVRQWEVSKLTSHIQTPMTRERNRMLMPVNETKDRRDKEEFFFFLGGGIFIEILVDSHVVIRNTMERLYIFPSFSQW